jgi:hypothetical protein
MASLLRLGVILAAAAAGCGGASKPYRTAAVSGCITLDGRPLAGARVTFTPIHDPRTGSASGPEAHGETDADGRYALKTVFGDRGATVGPNRVMVSTLKTEPNPNDPDAPHKVVVKEKVPKDYFTDKAALRFEVPAGGSDAANFDLRSR